MGRIIGAVFCSIIFLLISNCDEDDKPADKIEVLGLADSCDPNSVQNIVGLPTTIYSDRYYFFSIQYETEYAENWCWMGIKGHNWQDDDTPFSSVQPSDVYCLVIPADSVNLPDGYLITLYATIGDASYGNQTSEISIDFPQMTFRVDSISSPPLQYDIEEIVFGSNDHNDDGTITGVTNSFYSAPPAIYYSVTFKEPFTERTKIRKVWRKDNSLLFKAIQIVEAEQNKIWGVIKRHDESNLETGNYLLTIEKYIETGNYEILGIDLSLTSNNFIIH